MATSTGHVAYYLAPLPVPAPGFSDDLRQPSQVVPICNRKWGSSASKLVIRRGRAASRSRGFSCKALDDGSATGQGVATLQPAGEQGGVREVDVVVVGAGLAGLSAAREIHRAGLSCLLLEAADGVGGRVRTDELDGFVLDRGFQIFLSAYPTAKEMLDYDALDLRPFYAGANVWFQGTFHRVADPFRHPIDGVLSLSNPIGSVLDKILVGLLRFKCVAKPLDVILSSPEVPIIEKLEKEGFSSTMVDRFFRPFLGGIFFDRNLGTTSRMLELVLRMLALGANTLPARGIGAIPQQLAASLPPDSIQLNTKVDQIVPGGSGGPKATVQLAGGKSVRAKAGVVVAVEGPEGKRLLEGPLAASPSKDTPPRGTVCLYFAATKVPMSVPILFLNGTPEGIVNNMCFPSTVVPEYAPKGQSLVSVSLIGDHAGTSDEVLERRVREELQEWFGAPEIDGWRHLRTYRIPYAQPDQRPPTNLKREVRLGEGLYVCGDHRDSATFDGALVSGRRAAKSLLQEVQRVGTALV